MKRPFVTATVICVVSCSLVSCGNYITTDVSGRTGLSRNEKGELVVHVQPCDIDIGYVTISGPNIDGVNEDYAHYISSEPVLGPFSIDTSDIQAGWEEKIPTRIPDDRSEMIIVNSISSTRDAQTLPVDALLGEVRDLEVGEVLSGSKDSRNEVTTRKIQTEEEFKVCD